MRVEGSCGGYRLFQIAADRHIAITSGLGLGSGSSSGLELGVVVRVRGWDES
jgi:hypothetical protein